ncbi:MAG: aminotransferase class V-fold PLP-dependent enzyme [Proteobacteria bacterium]|nr:aminotransferase class V-fold PLP-dependent enzyme [Pseudomonadota bacterium]
MSHVAVVSASNELRERWLFALEECSQNDPVAPNSCDYRFLPCESAEQALQLAAGDGLLQAVIIDTVTIDGADELVRSLKALRAELDLFLAVDQNSEFSSHAVELLDRNDDNISHLFRQVQSAIAHRANTPFADTLRDYVYSAKDAWHTPGHSGGASLRDSPWVSDFHQMMGEHIFNTDLSVSVQVLDSLLEPHSVIQEAQDLAAEAFGAQETFFVTNGTSTANKVIIQHLLGAGGKMIVDQACHKSIHHAVILFGVEPVYLHASLKEEYGFYGPVPKQHIYDAIDSNSDARLLVLTSCTYDGFYYDLKPIIEYAHQHGMKVLIDEAWYAHGRFHPDLRPNALECGADYVTQSTHKMLSAFSQASMIHVADPDFDEHRFREDLNMHTSTSPQYAMIASLDVARKQMSMEGFLQLSRCMDVAARLRAGIDKTGVFRVLKLEDMLPEELAGDGIRLDPSKLSIDISASGMSARELQLELFEDYGVQVEKVTHNTLSVLVTLGSTESKVLRLLNAFKKIAIKANAGKEVLRRSVPPLPQLSAFHVLPRDAYFGKAKEVSLLAEQHGLNEGVIGAISADLVVPYPPGIPVLIPGQEITDSIARFLLNLYHSKNGMEIHGLVERGDNAFLRVVDRG